jgi:hypothetical protein
VRHGIDCAIPDQLFQIRTVNADPPAEKFYVRYAFLQNPTSDCVGPQPQELSGLAHQQQLLAVLTVHI